jgi:hypothetical protein
MNIGDKVKFPKGVEADFAGEELVIIEIDDNVNGQLLTLRNWRGATCAAYAHEVELAGEAIVDQPGVLP